MQKQNYYLGLDVGTNSVGYAVTDEQYHLLKFKGEPMWGSHVFEDGDQCAERRGFRTGRRRLDRRQQRVRLVQEIFAKEVAAVDDRFFIRLKESALYREDRERNEAHVLFCDEDYTDVRFFEEYPTIHHLIVSLMEDEKPHDVRQVYLAVAWLVAHRGHFLSDVDKENVEKVLNFDSVYDSFLDCYRAHFNSYDMPWECENTQDFQRVLLMKTSIREKEKAFQELLFGGKRKKEDEDTVISSNAILRLLAGGTVAVNDLFCQRENEEKTSISFRKSQEEFEAMLAELDEEAELLVCLRNIYDWSILYEESGGDVCISKTKIQVYKQHEKDLQGLKKFVRKYLPHKYGEIFREAGELHNYVSYSYNTSSVGHPIEGNFKKCNKEEFCTYIKRQVRDVSCDEEDKVFYEDMMQRLECWSFMPKQVDGDNRVIPYQLYYHELKMILQKAEHYLPFLKEKDAEGYTNKDKLLAIMEYRIPYYVGPLHPGNGANHWIVRRADATGPIRPWNFETKVDLDACETDFIKRMTNACTYLPGESVMPKHALLYCKYQVLNLINNIKINGASISVECKQGIYGLFEEKRNVSERRIRDYLISNNYMEKTDEMSGLDIELKASLKSYHDFRRLLSTGTLCESDVEKIIERITYSEERVRVKKWLDKEFYFLTEDDRKYISRLKYKDFGRLSVKFLTGLKGVDRETGEDKSIIRIMWDTNDNLMQILFSDRYHFQELLQEAQQDYYREHPANTEKLLEDMGVSNAVKRPIYRTLDIVRDVKKACGAAPEKIFIEMARGGGVKGQRTDSRRKQIEKLYQVCDRKEVQELSKELEGKSDNELQSEVLFLYFMQLGRCMYSGDPIDIHRLKIDTYVNIDHIYPQAYVKDDSLDNKVLVFSTLNGTKGNQYPIDAGLPGTCSRMMDIWKKYRDCGLISKEKYNRLVRNTPFSDEEKMNFINRQLVETRQSTKALAELLKGMFPTTKIIYVKAGLSSDFRKEYGIKKSRQINDLHHAKDAYLNIVCGNVYHSKFTDRFFKLSDNYSIKTKTIFGQELRIGNNVVWQGEASIAETKRILAKNNIHYTRYAFCRKGGLFDQQPKRKGEGLVPRKAGLNPEKYGGYQKTTASFFILSKYVLTGKKTKTDMMIVPIELMVADKVLESEEFATEYVRTQIAQILKKSQEEISMVSFPLGQRPIKVNTRFSFDGFESCVTGKSSGGRQLGFVSMMSLIVDDRKTKYIKSLEVFAQKRQINAEIQVDEEYDGISKLKNEELYRFFKSKVQVCPYSKVFGSLQAVLQNGCEKFEALSVEEQALFLLKLLDIFKTGRVTGCDLTAIGGVKKSGVYTNSSSVSNWMKYFSDVRLIDESASGLYCSTSDNLLELL